MPIVDAIAQAVAPLREALAQSQAALAEAKRTIRALLAHLHGVKSERSALVLTAEGQRFIDEYWASLGEQAAVVAAPPKEPLSRAARDPRGVAQRHPHIPIKSMDAPVPDELREQVEAGTIELRRTGRFDDALVAPEAKPFIRRCYEVEIVKPATGVALLQLPLPERIVTGGVLADESIHRLVIAKFLDATPFHRTLAAWARSRIEIARQVVNDAFAAWSGIFAPLADEIIDQVLHADVVHADESWARRQAEGRCATVNIWTLVGGGQVGYRYTPDRTHARAGEIIPADFAGYLVRDAWKGWQTLTDVSQAGCNAHARRPFAKVAHENNADAAIIVRLYAEVYRLEHLAAAGPPNELLDRRRRIRDQQTRPLMERIRTEATRIAGAYPFSHELAEGARYIGNQFDSLIRFLDNPLLPPDNNAAEGALRINALIRKNSLFFGSDAGGKNAAIALTILHSCKLAKVEPAAYLARVTPILLSHRLGRKQDLTGLTPLALAIDLAASATSPR